MLGMYILLLFPFIILLLLLIPKFKPPPPDSSCLIPFFFTVNHDGRMFFSLKSLWVLLLLLPLPSLLRLFFPLLPSSSQHMMFHLLHLSLIFMPFPDFDPSGESRVKSVLSLCFFRFVSFID